MTHYAFNKLTPRELAMRTPAGTDESTPSNYRESITEPLFLAG
jgi:hypothetical protein